MKRILSALLALAVLAALVIVAATSKHGVRAIYAQNGCTDATLTGSYGLVFGGFSVEQSGPVPFDGEGLFAFDGAGNLSGVANASQNGGPFQFNYTAKYKVNSNCTGDAVSTNGNDNFAFVIVGGGAEILGTDISSNTLNLDFKKE